MTTFKLLSQLVLFVLITLIITLKLCCPKDDEFLEYSKVAQDKMHSGQPVQLKIEITKDIIIKDYFYFIDSIVAKYDSITQYKLTEHLVVRSNPWIIDTLKNTDYYLMKERDSFVYNQKMMIVLKKGSHITIPDNKSANRLEDAFKNTLLDINIPEFKLRIYEDSVKLYEFPIRVGRNEKRYLKMAGKVLDIKTKVGSGIIVNHVRDPQYYNPVNGHKYFVTKRDDGQITKLPQIPFLETEINGLRSGQLIHPTTNPITLGKAYSNGCIGTRESDAWVIYYYAPIGTRITVRYDLDIVDENSNPIVLEDIYK